jgi:hypothetical protein
MKVSETRAEIFFMALQSLSKPEKEMVIRRLLDDPQLREDIIDLVTISSRKCETSRPFRNYLSERENEPPEK